MPSVVTAPLLLLPIDFYFSHSFFCLRNNFLYKENIRNTQIQKIKIHKYRKSVIHKYRTLLSISHLWELISSVRPTSNEPKLRLLLVGPCSSKRGRGFGLLRMGWDGREEREAREGPLSPNPLLARLPPDDSMVR